MRSAESIAKRKAYQQTEEYKEKAREQKRKYYLKNKATLLAKQKKYRATPQGKAKHNAANKAVYYRLSPEKRQKRNAVSNNARTKLFAKDRRRAEQELERARKNMHELRKNPEFVKKLRAYQKIWNVKKRELRQLNNEYDAFLDKLNKESILHEVNQIIARRKAKSGQH